jgi:threonine/homoserine/homoserine lactone efflux protein
MSFNEDAINAALRQGAVDALAAATAECARQERHGFLQNKAQRASRGGFLTSASSPKTLLW